MKPAIRFNKSVNPFVKPCSLCPDLKKQIENLAGQVENLASENQQILSAQETLQKQLSELEKNQVEKVSESKPKTPKKVIVRQPQDQPLKVDLAELERETGIKKD